MRANEFLLEGLNHPMIVVDVQPEYAYYTPQTEKICADIIRFVTKQTGPVLMLVNAEDSGVSADTKEFITQYWNNIDVEDWDDEDPSVVTNNVNWSRFTFIDKGYGHLRSWMDQGVPPAVIIKVIRAMYQEKVNDSRELFGGEDSDEYEAGMQTLMGNYVSHAIGGDCISVGWACVATLKKFSGAYLVGGGRNECLREVELLMNAFNIKYKRIDSLVY
jgi:hypothetical protein